MAKVDAAAERIEAVLVDGSQQGQGMSVTGPEFDHLVLASGPSVVGPGTLEEAEHSVYVAVDTC